jgi:excisionase family DNA binding protein
MGEDRVLSLAEVAERLGRHVQTVRRWVRAKRIRAVNLGGRGEGARYGVRESVLDAFVASREGGR